MYKISFYPEFFARREAAKKNVLGIALASFLLGLAALILVIQFLSAHLLDERAQSLGEAIPRLSSGLIDDSGTAPELLTARALVEIRARRLDWAPKLAALSDHLSAHLKLLHLEAHVGQKATPAIIELNGEIRRRDDQLQAVSDYIALLQDDARISKDLPSVRLGNLREGSASQFLLTCEARVEKSK